MEGYFDDSAVFPVDPTAPSPLVAAANAVVYYTFHELPYYQSGNTLAQVGETITSLLSKQGCWRSAFDAITHMRVLNKNFPEQVNEIFIGFGMQILDNIEGVKTCTLKNTLIFMNEVFLSSRAVKLNDVIIEKFVPIILQKSIDETKLIQHPAQEALTTFADTCCLTDAAYATLIKVAVLHKSPAVQEIAMKILRQLIALAKDSLTSLAPSTFTILMKGLTQTIANPRGQIKTLTKQVMEAMSEAVGNQNYVNMTQNVLTAEENQSIQHHYQEHFAKQTKQKSTRDLHQLNRKSITQLKAHAKKSLAPEFRAGANVIEIKTSHGEQSISILQEHNSNTSQQQQQLQYPHHFTNNNNFSHQSSFNTYSQQQQQPPQQQQQQLQYANYSNGFFQNENNNGTAANGFFR